MESQAGRPIVIRVGVMDLVDSPQNRYSMVQAVLAVSQQIEQQNGDDTADPIGNSFPVQQPIAAGGRGGCDQHGAGAINPAGGHAAEKPKDSVAAPAARRRRDQRSTWTVGLPQGENHESQEQQSPFQTAFVLIIRFHERE